MKIIQRNMRKVKELLTVLFFNAVINGENCTSMSPSAVKFSFKSGKNITGNWNAQVHLQHAVLPSLIEPWEVDMKQDIEQCKGIEYILSWLIFQSKQSTVRGPSMSFHNLERKLGYEYIPGLGYYKFHTDLKTWFEARDSCEQEGARLAVMNSDKEVNLLLHFWTPHPKIGDYTDWRKDWAYIGIHDNYDEGEYVTIFGDHLNATGYTKWLSGQPNGGVNENCGVMQRTTNLLARIATSMRKLLVFFMVLAINTICKGERCNSLHPSSVKFSLKSEKNSTGNWCAQVQFQHAVHPNLPGPWEIDMEQVTEKCNELEYITIMANISGYELIPKLGYYKFHSEVKSWFEASDKCVQEGAHLLVINSDSEASAVMHFWTSHPKIANYKDWKNDWAHIGFHDRFVEGEYVTIFGDYLNATGYSKWYPGQPNTGVHENCGCIDRSAILLGDVACHVPLAFFCERELQ
ncbi:hypothetical protein C0J52_12569 [Blattella germanica]|nr:hypothetical protein C0J52_12569 [Blattella germanica]